MSDYNYEDQLQEISASVQNTKRILQAALDDVNAILRRVDDNATNDTFDRLSQMLRELRVQNNMCVESLCEDAMRDE